MCYLEAVPNKKNIGKLFKKDAKVVTDALTEMSAKELSMLQKLLQSEG